MATLVRIDDEYINLDNVTHICVLDFQEQVEVHFAHEDRGKPHVLSGERGARLLKWLDAGGRVGVA